MPARKRLWRSLLSLLPWPLFGGGLAVLLSQVDGDNPADFALGFASGLLLWATWRLLLQNLD